MIRISRLTDPKSCLPTFTLKAQPTMSDNTVFYTFKETIISGVLENVNNALPSKCTQLLKVCLFGVL